MELLDSSPKVETVALTEDHPDPAAKVAKSELVCDELEDEEEASAPTPLQSLSQSTLFYSCLPASKDAMSGSFIRPIGFTANSDSDSDSTSEIDETESAANISFPLNNADASAVSYPSAFSVPVVPVSTDAISSSSRLHNLTFKCMIQDADFFFHEDASVASPPPASASPTSSSCSSDPTSASLPLPLHVPGRLSSDQLAAAQTSAQSFHIGAHAFNLFVIPEFESIQAADLPPDRASSSLPPPIHMHFQLGHFELRECQRLSSPLPASDLGACLSRQACVTHMSSAWPDLPVGIGFNRVQTLDQRQTEVAAPLLVLQAMKEVLLLWLKDDQDRKRPALSGATVVTHVHATRRSVLFWCKSR